MARSFNSEMRCQQEWGWLLATWLFLSGTASGLFLLYEIADLPEFFGLLSVALLVLGGVVLVLEQGSPLRAWRAVSRARTSWLSRGVIFVVSFLVSSMLALAPAVLPGLAWEGGLIRFLHGIAGLCALMVVLYPGFFLANNRSIPFWHTPMLPLVLLTYAAVGASALVLVGSDYVTDALQRYRVLAVSTILSNLVLVCVYLLWMHRGGSAARESVRLINTSPLSWIFWGGVMLVGMVLPLVLVPWIQAAAAPAGLCMLLGCFLFRYCLMKVGVYVPAALAQQGLDFSRLNRTSTELEREYAGAAASPTGGRS